MSHATHKLGNSNEIQTIGLTCCKTSSYTGLTSDETKTSEGLITFLFWKLMTSHELAQSQLSSLGPSHAKQKVWKFRRAVLQNEELC